MNEAKVEALIEHITEGGSLEQDDLAEALSLSPRSLGSIEKYLSEASDRLDEELEIGGDNPYANESEEEPETDPDVEDKEEPEPEPEPEPTTKTKSKKKVSDFRYFLEKPDGTADQLEFVKQGGSVITFRKVEPKDLVKLIIKGELVEVDIIPLRKADPAGDSEFGVSNEKLLSLALAAKG